MLDLSRVSNPFSKFGAVSLLVVTACYVRDTDVDGEQLTTTGLGSAGHAGLPSSGGTFAGSSGSLESGASMTALTVSSGSGVDSGATGSMSTSDSSAETSGGAATTTGGSASDSSASVEDGTTVTPDDGSSTDATNTEATGEGEEAGDAADSSDACEAHELRCDGVCIDPRSDPMHCGATGSCRGDEAGTKCGVGRECREGECRSLCSEDEVWCDAECIDPETDAGHCGATADCTGPNAGETCERHFSCRDGTCVCQPDCGSFECGLDPVCGSVQCGTCDPGNVCTAGSCKSSCDESEVFCDGECIDPAVHHAHCGARGSCRGDEAGESCSEREVCEHGRCTVQMGWSPSVFISKATQLGDAAGPRLAAAPNGAVTAVWKQHDSASGGARSIWSSRYDPEARAWSPAQRVEHDSGAADRPEIVVDQDGHATVVWQQLVGDRVQIRASRAGPGSLAWSEPVAVETLASGDSWLHENNLVVSEMGVVLLVFLHSAPDSIDQDIWSVRYEPRSGRWGNLIAVEHGLARRSFSSGLALNERGRATYLMVYDEAKTGPGDVLTSVDLPPDVSTWTDEVEVWSEPAARLGINTPSLVIDAASGAIGVWHGSTGGDTSQTEVWASRRRSSAWSGPDRVSAGVGDADEPEIVLDVDGNATVTWRERVQSASWVMWSSRLGGSDERWSSPRRIDPSAQGEAHRHKLVVTPDGSVLSAWTELEDGVRSLWVTRWGPGERAWDPSIRLESEHGGSAFVGSVDSDARGDVTVVWRQDSGNRKDVMSARYEPQRSLGSGLGGSLDRR